MTRLQHGVRIALLMAGASGLFVWLTGHSEVTFADGLRYIRQAERLDRGEWSEGLWKAVDHPLHPLVLVATRRALGGEGPVSWQRAAQVTSIAAAALLVLPLYLLGLELFDETTAWLGCLLFLAHTMVGSVVINVLSETTFLVFWTWGLWCAVRFLKAGRFSWLAGAVAFGSLAYLVRPEGLLLPLALVVTLLLIPWHWATRLPWPRWSAAVALLVVGPLLTVGPYMAAKGGVGTKPSIARLIGTAPEAPSLALERDRPLPPGQSAARTFRLAVERSVKVLRNAVTPRLLPFLVLGLILGWSDGARWRVWIFLSVIVAASAAALVRLYTTGGYCTVRHALVPGMILTLSAAHGLGWLLRSVLIDGRWIGRAGNYYRLGPVLWGAVLLVLVGPPYARLRTPKPGSFASYRAAGAWIAREASGGGRVLDVTDWALYFSGRPGSVFADVYDASADPRTRWVVVRNAHMQGHWHYTAVLRELLDGLEPVARFPEHPRHGQLQIWIYDLRARRALPLAGRTVPAACR